MIPEGQGEPPFRDHLFPDTHRHSTEVAAITAIRFAHHWLGRLTAFVAGSILAVMTILVFLTVIYRYFLLAPISWGEEMARFLFIALSLFGAALAMRDGTHFRITLLAEKLPRLGDRLKTAPGLLLERRRSSLDHTGARLQALSPLATLGRGYAIVRAGADALRDAAAVTPGDRLEIQLARGTLGATDDEVRP